MDANETRHDYAQKLREVKEIPASGHRDIARREIIRLEAENTRLRKASTTPSAAQWVLCRIVRWSFMRLK